LFLCLKKHHKIKGSRDNLHASLTSALEWCEWSVTFIPRPLCRRGKILLYPLDRAR